MTHHEELTRELRGRAADVDGHPVSFADVQRRADRIRRRRRAAAAAVVAGVVAVLVPAGVLAGRTLDGSDPAPADTTPSVPAPRPRLVELTSDVPAGDGPAAAYFLDGAIHVPGGGEVRVDQDLDYLAAYRDGWVGSANDDQGRWTTYVYDAEGEVTGSYPSTGPVAVSPDRTLAAFATPGGQVQVLRDAAPSPAGLRTKGASPLSPVAVGGAGGRCVDYERPGRLRGDFCAVFYSAGGEPAQAYLTATVPAPVGKLPFRSVAGVSDDGRMAGTVSVSDAGSCSAVFDSLGVEEWRTCGYTLGRFSPDGRYVIGRPAYLDGIGDGVLAVLDARTGETLVDARPEGDAWVFVADSVWQDDGTVLATVWDTDHWALLRLTPDGELTRALPDDIPGEAERDPVALAATP